VSTRSVVGRLIGDGDLAGRYVHFDGHPDSMGPELWRIIKRDGATAAADLICSYQGGWSYLQADTGKGPERDGLLCVDGYGGAYDDGRDLGVQDQFSQEYGYAIGPDTLTVWDHGNLVGTFKLDEDEPDWKKV